MKKTLLTVAAAATLAAGAFAEVTFGAWARMVVVPVAHDSHELRAGLNQSWGGTPRVFGLSVNGVTEGGKVGAYFQMFKQYDSDNESAWKSGLADGDNAAMWYKPVDGLTISLGSWEDNSLRTDLCFGQWDTIRAAGADDAKTQGVGEKFSFQGMSNTGVGVNFSMIENLTVIAGVPFNFLEKGGDVDGYHDRGQFERAYKGVSAQVGYNVMGLAKIKLGYYGGKAKQLHRYSKGSYGKNCHEYFGEAEVGLDLTPVDGLFVTLGARFDLMDSEYGKWVKTDRSNGELKAREQVYAAGLRYGFGLGTVYAGAKVAVEAVKTPLVSFGVGADFVVMDGLTALADFRMVMRQEYSYNSGVYGGDFNDPLRGLNRDIKGKHVSEGAISFSAGLRQDLGGANVTVAFVGQTNAKRDMRGLKPLNAHAGDQDHLMFQVPVVFTYSF